MEFEIILKNIDLIRAISYAHLRNKAIWAMCIMPAILINGVGVVGLWAMGWPRQESLSVLLEFLIWVFGLCFVGLGLTILSLLLNPKWRKGRIGLHKIEINEKGMVESTEYNRSEIYWPSIRKASNKSSGLYFLHSGADSFIIPRRCFASKQSWENFTNLFFMHYQGAK